MSGDKLSDSGMSGQGSDAGSGAAAAPKPARPAMRHLDVEVRDAYRKAFGKKAGNVTAGRSGLGGYRVTVFDPTGKEIPGIGDTREAAYDNLLDHLKGVFQEEEADELSARRTRGGTAEEKEERASRGKEILDAILNATDEDPAPRRTRPSTARG